MGNRLDITGADYIRCPYFKKHNSVQICCEGVLDDATSAIYSYQTKAEKEQRQHQYCELDYRSCEHYKAVTAARYSDENDKNDRRSRRSFTLELHKKVRENDIRYSAIADALYISESSLYRWLRHPLTKEREGLILRAVEALKERKETT